MTEELRLILTFLGSTTFGALGTKVIDAIIAHGKQEVDEERGIRQELREENKALKARERALMDEQRAYFQAELEKNTKIHNLETALAGVREELDRVKALVVEVQGINRMLMARLDDNLLYAVLEAAADILIVYDLEGRLLYVNAPAVQLIGRPEGELLGKLTAELTVEPAVGRLLTRLAGEMAKVMETGQPVLSSASVTATRNRRVFECRLWSVCDRRGDAYAIACLGRDTTEGPGRAGSEPGES